MKINIRKLILEWNDTHPDDKLTQRKLAREMVEDGRYKSELSARQMLQYYSRNEVNIPMLEFLKKKFGKSTNEILTD